MLKVTKPCSSERKGAALAAGTAMTGLLEEWAINATGVCMSQEMQSTHEDQLAREMSATDGWEKVRALSKCDIFWRL